MKQTTRDAENEIRRAIRRLGYDINAVQVQEGHREDADYIELEIRVDHPNDYQVQ